jgi:stearoyl-CoA desaturase (Delta-9 desaturase)
MWNMAFDPLFGLIPLSILGYILFVLISTHLSVVAMTIYLHRNQAHRMIDLHPAVAHFFRFWLWFATAMTTKIWVSIHRKHHAKCETADDPHSPQVFGLHRVLFGFLTQGVFLSPLHKTLKEKVYEEYGHATPNDWIERKVYRHQYLGLGLLLAVDLVLFGTVGIAIFLIQAYWLPFWAAGVVNGVGHYFGYRNTNTPDQSRNIIPFGLLLGGEELHNNHHAKATSAKFSAKWFEIDLGFMYIKLLSWLRLAKIRTGRV